MSITEQQASDLLGPDKVFGPSAYCQVIEALGRPELIDRRINLPEVQKAAFHFSAREILNTNSAEEKEIKQNGYAVLLPKEFSITGHKFFNAKEIFQVGQDRWYYHQHFSRLCVKQSHWVILYPDVPVDSLNLTLNQSECYMVEKAPRLRWATALEYFTLLLFLHWSKQIPEKRLLARTADITNCDSTVVAGMHAVVGYDPDQNTGPDIYRFTERAYPFIGVACAYS